jgi:hypothetical protein
MCLRRGISLRTKFEWPWGEENYGRASSELCELGRCEGWTREVQRGINRSCLRAF